MIQEIDDCIMEPAQRLSDWIHSLTGYDSIQQSRFCAGVSALGWLLIIVEKVRGRQGFPWVFALILISRTYDCFFENELHVLIRSECQQGFRNRHRADRIYRVLRIFNVAILLLISSGVGWPWIVMLVGACGLLLFGACDVQTPRTGRIREALSRLAAQIFLTPARIPPSLSGASPTV